MNVITGYRLVNNRFFTKYYSGYDFISFPQNSYIYFSFEKLSRYGHNM